MSRVVMFVYNDATHDSRVLREAESLAYAGHEVTVMARPTDVEHGSTETERSGRFEITRVAVPGGWRGAWRAVAYPWRAPGLLRFVLLPWTMIRVPFVLWARRRPVRRSGTVEWLVVWRFATMGWARDAARMAPVADVYHGHDLHGLAAAARAQAAHGGRLVYDSHEIFVESGSYVHRPRWVRAMLARTERRLTRRAEALVTVNEAVGAELVRRLRPRRLVVVHNCPPHWEAPRPLPDRLRAAAGIPAGTQVLLYHGGFSRHRGLEQLAEASLLPDLAGCHVVYLGYGGLRPQLDALAADPRYGGRLHVLDAVDPSVLLEWIAPADVGVLAIQHSTMNHYLSTPNKLFECLTAGVPVVASDFPDIRRIVLDDPAGPLGAICDPADPASIAAAARTILELDPTARRDLSERCRRAARERWNWETESARLVALYADLAGAAPTGGSR